MTLTETTTRDQLTHTKGPWTVSPLDKRNVGPTTLLHTDGGVVPQLQSVAIVRERMNETDANARLIAAAPELLAACKAFLKWVMPLAAERTFFAVEKTVIDVTLAAIAKAEGR